MGTTMVQAFRELNADHSRMAALDLLLHELSPYEWRALASKLNARSFHFDIVGNLPVEIVAIIFSYLNTSTSFRLQAVCRRWHTLLRSPPVWKQSLRTWYDGPTGIPDDYTLYTAKARDIHRFRTGQFTQVVTDTESLSSGLYALFENTLVRASPDQRKLIVEDLRTRTSWTTHGDAREAIVTAAVSERLVAYTTSRGVCYVSDLRGKSKTNFKLPSGMVNVLACNGVTVVCAGSNANAIEVYVWQFDTRRGKSFRIGFDQSPFASCRTGCECLDMLIIPNSSSRALIICTSKSCASSGCQNRGKDDVPCSIYTTRFSFEGQKLGDNKLEIPHFAGISMCDYQPVDRRGGYAIEVRTQHRESVWDDPPAYVSFLFDEPSNTFRDPKCPVSEPAVYAVPEGIMWWKDTFYRLLSDPSFAALGYCDDDLVLACVGWSHEPGLWPVVSLGNGKFQYREKESLDLSEQYFRRDAHLLLNDKFAVVLDKVDALVYIISFEGAL